MSDVQDENEPAIDGAPDKPRMGKKKKMIIGAAAALLLAGGSGGAYMAFGGDKPAGEEHAEDADRAGGEPVFVDVPPMVVNLRSADGAARFVKLHFMLVPGPKGEAAALEKKLPLLLDALQPFLRELRPEDLAGSAAVFRIKEEMLARAHDTLGAGQVEDVLIQDLIQQ